MSRDRERTFNPKRERSQRPMAFVGRKGCGCIVFARLAGDRIWGSGKLEKVAKGLDVQRVPLEQANVVICRCGA